MQSLKKNPGIKDDVAAQKKEIPYIGELMLGHVRYGTFGGNSVETVHPFLRQNNWMHRNLIIAGNFNMTNTTELFQNLIDLGMHPKEKADTITILENIGHFLDQGVAKLYKKAKKKGLSKMEASAHIIENLNIEKILKKVCKKLGWWLCHGRTFGARRCICVA